MSVETIETILPDTILLLALANKPAAMRVDALHFTSDHFFHHLRVTRGIKTANEILRRHSSDSLRDTIAVAVVDDSDRSTIHAGDAIFRIVSERPSGNATSVTVCVVRVTGRAVI